MEMDTANFGDWAHDAFLALNNDVHPSTEKWPAFNNNLPQSAFSIPPSLLSQGSIERYGQVTPPEELSPAEPRRDSPRDNSVPLEQLKNEALFPSHQLQALQNYQPQQEASSEQSQEAQERSSKRRRTTRGQAPANQPRDPASSQQDSANPQPPKRKRGRPKSQPQTVEAYTADGYPVQVSSARESHLEKNRVAAHKCRQRKKEYIGGLEDRARIYSQKNKALKENVAILREEVLELKNEVLRHAGCGFWAVDEYLARCAGDLLGVDAPTTTASLSEKPSQQPSPTQTTLVPELPIRESSAESLPSQFTTDTAEHNDEFGLDLLNDMDEDMESHDA